MNQLFISPVVETDLEYGQFICPI